MPTGGCQSVNCAHWSAMWGGEWCGRCSWRDKYWWRHSWPYGKWHFVIGKDPKCLVMRRRKDSLKFTNFQGVNNRWGLRFLNVVISLTYTWKKVPWAWCGWLSDVHVWDVQLSLDTLQLSSLVRKEVYCSYQLGCWNLHCLYTVQFLKWWTTIHVTLCTCACWWMVGFWVAVSAWKLFVRDRFQCP